jgi:predicted nucleic acid-binding protein
VGGAPTRGLTLDSGALIGFERRGQVIVDRISEAVRLGIPLTIPAICVAETWRGGPRAGAIARLLRLATVEPLDERLARSAGELLRRARASDVVDATVVAGAARRGDVILTTDPGDIERLAASARHVKVMVV